MIDNHNPAEDQRYFQIDLMKDGNLKFRTRIEKLERPEFMSLLVFSSVIFLQIEGSWRGSTFKTGTNERCLELIRRSNNSILRSLSDKEIIGQYKLFISTIKRNNKHIVEILLIAKDMKLEPFSTS